jgi:asparagine synthase (glutamine-hydrolysing)
MCGIAGTIGGSLCNVQKMGDAINKRGITNDLYQDRDLLVYFSWLPITDNYAQMQPYIEGKYRLWLNGYISNWKELASQYNIEMTSKCDTELLVKLYAKYGADCIDWLNGFFSIVVWDGEKIQMYNDRYGIKQMYYTWEGGNFYFASEVKGLLKIKSKIELNEEAVIEWKTELGVLSPHTLFDGIYKNTKRVFIHNLPKLEISYEDAKRELLYLFNQSISRNKIHNKRDCVFLSGGIDSGIIANFIKPDYSFSCDYLLSDFSEIENIKKNSKGKHYGIIVSRDLFKEYLPKTFEALDDLKAGSSWTNYALTELASKFATVIYSGAGGDELFNGYTHRYSKPIGEVINRVGAVSNKKVSHKEYDWSFLEAVLIVEDRMAGHFAMETRYPLLDNDFVNFALQLPDEYKKDKRILKDISGLSEQVKSGQKKGFSNPYLNNKEWAEYALKEIIKRYDISSGIHSI